MKDHDEDLMLRRAVSHLPKSIEPGRDLWAGIQAATEEPGARPAARAPAWGWALAASVLGIAIGVSVTLAVMSERSAPVPVAARASAGDYTFVPASTNQVRMDLRRDAIAQLAKLAPNTRAHVQADLDTISKALSDIQSALAKDPGNALLQDLLVTTYQDELSTLANVQALAGSAHSGVSL